MDTIFATSSGSPPAAIAVIRISGPRAFSAVQALVGKLPPLRAARLRALRDADGGLLDRALVLTFDAPRTATGEDIAELHVHGGRAVVAAVEAALARMPELRRADPGEFTRRALVNGVIDLTEAEGLGDLLAAETEAQRRAALAVAEGGLRTLIEQWTTELVALAAQVEAMLDFAEEDDVDAQSLLPVGQGLGRIADEIDALLATPPVERLRDGVRVVLAGPPNTGKSTLLNRMADRDVAIVSPIAGTTRDRIEVPVVRRGIAYLLTDTAGLAESTDDAIERMGITRAQAAMSAADIVLWFGDDAPSEGALWLAPLCDVEPRQEKRADRLPVSGATGEGMDRLWDAIDRRVKLLLPIAGSIVSNARQRSLLADGASALRRGARHVDPILLAEELRIALTVFDRVTGRANVEHVLDALFGRFCLGK